MVKLSHVDISPVSNFFGLADVRIFKIPVEPGFVSAIIPPSSLTLEVLFSVSMYFFKATALAFVSGFCSW